MRSLITATFAGVAILALAACSDSGDNQTADEPAVDAVAEAAQTEPAAGASDAMESAEAQVEEKMDMVKDKAVEAMEGMEKVVEEKMEEATDAKTDMMDKAKGAMEKEKTVKDN